jgi:hypothetical protein
MRFSGTSKNGSFQEALDHAIRAAADGLGGGGADIRINWNLLLVSGASGGFAGQKDLTVEILAVAS